MKNIVILGSTGSIGKQALQVASRDKYHVLGLTAANNIDLLEMQARQFMPKVVAIANCNKVLELKRRLSDTNIEVLSGESGICEIASMKCDIVLNSIVGIAGLRPTLSTINAGNTLALANKETLVTAGELVNKAAKKNKVKIIPVDSEHSAIFQSLQGTPKGSLKKILLTASGGPFYGRKTDELKNITVKEALKHPNWSMGAKITIDSATLMNKGLEVIEAVHLFGVKASQIEVLVHRQSILHSGVELTDGAVIAQLGTPDMRLPIAYAMTYPARSGNAFEHLSLSEIGCLTFKKPDTETFKCLPLCISAINMGGLAPAAVNGANEEAVKLFLLGRIKFLQIADLVEKALYSVNNKLDYTIDDVFEADLQARCLVNETIK